MKQKKNAQIDKPTTGLKGNGNSSHTHNGSKTGIIQLWN